MHLTAETLVQHFEMLPHPEGGYFKETYRAETTIKAAALPANFGGDRQASTAIYFLLEKGNFSAFHKIKSDECWHFYAGQALHIYVLNQDKTFSTIKLGNNLANDEVFQAVVPANCWFASEPSNESTFCFVGCTVAPGFDFKDFELANSNELAAEFPAYDDLIYRMCR